MELKSVAIHGHQVAYYQAGSGPALLLVHGIGGSGQTWKRVFARLAERYTVIAPDLVGHGASERPRGDYSLGAHASGLRDLLVRLGVERATVCGHSLGGGVAMVFAYQFPEMCERLVLVSSGGLGAEVSPLLRLLSLPGAEYVIPVGTSSRVTSVAARAGGALGRLGFSLPPAADELWRSYASLGSADARRSFLATVREVIDFRGQRVSANDRLYLAAEMPVLIVWGAKDRLIPVEHARRAHREMPGSRLEVFDGSGHFPHAEEPGRFLETLNDFLESTVPSVLTPARLRHLIQGGETRAKARPAQAARKTTRRRAPRKTAA